jgi:hypothetical protein
MSHREKALEDTFYFHWTSRDFSTGFPATLTSGVLRAYPDNSATQITAGLTIAEHDSVTGLNLISVVATAANTYADETDYTLVIQSGTINGVPAAGLVVGSFSLGEVDRLVWDAPLTAGTHNVQNSGGRRLRAINEAAAYEDGAVWINGSAGNTNTEDYEDGTPGNPVSTIGAANTIATSVGLTRFRIAAGTTITLAAAQQNQVFLGEGWTLALGGQDIVGSTFVGATVSGVAAGTGTTQFFEHCIMNATSHIKGTHLIACGIGGTQTLVEAGDCFFDRCHSAVAGSATPTFDFGAALNSSDLNVRNHSGGWTIENMGAGTGTYAASFEGHGQIIWAASCSATSNASVRGAWKITDNAAGAVTVTFDDTTTEVTAVKAITDQMVFTKANELDVNTQSINGAEVVGDGNATPWDGA